MSKLGQISEDDVTRSAYEAAVSKERARFRALVEHAPSVIVELDDAGRFQFVSPSVEEVFGYRPETLVGESAFDYIHPSDRERVERTFERGLAEPERLLTAEYRFRHADSRWPFVESRGHNRLHDPAVEGFVVNTVTSPPNAGPPLDSGGTRPQPGAAGGRPPPDGHRRPRGVVRRANEAARAEFGLTTDEVVGLCPDSDDLDLYDTDGDPLPKSETVNARVRATDEPVRDVTYECTTPNDDRFRITLSGAPLSANGEVTHVVLSFQEITPV